MTAAAPHAAGLGEAGSSRGVLALALACVLTHQSFLAMSCSHIKFNCPMSTLIFSKLKSSSEDPDL